MTDYQGPLRDKGITHIHITAADTDTAQRITKLIETRHPITTPTLHHSDNGLIEITFYTNTLAAADDIPHSPTPHDPVRACLKDHVSP